MEPALIKVDRKTRDILRKEGAKVGISIADTVRLLARKLASGGVKLL